MKKMISLLAISLFSTSAFGKDLRAYARQESVLARRAEIIEKARQALKEQHFGEVISKLLESISKDKVIGKCKIENSWSDGHFFVVRFRFNNKVYNAEVSLELLTATFENGKFVIGGGKWIYDQSSSGIYLTLKSDDSIQELRMISKEYNESGRPTDGISCVKGVNEYEAID